MRIVDGLLRLRLSRPHRRSRSWERCRRCPSSTGPRNSTLSRSVNSPPNTRCRSCSFGGSFAIGHLVLQPHVCRAPAARSTLQFRPFPASRQSRSRFARTRLRAVPGSNQRPMNRLTAIVDNRVLPQVLSASPRLRAPKDRRLQGPSRGCCRRPLRCRACLARRAQSAAPASECAARRQRSARLRKQIVDDALGPGERGRRRASHCR